MRILDCYIGGGQRNMMHNADIIIFNKAVGADRREVFLPTVIYNACWYASSSLDNNGSTSGNFKVRIPYRSATDGRKHYVPEHEYSKLSSEEKKRSWTLQKNSYVMVFREGVIRDRKEFSPEEVLDFGKKYDDFFIVTEYADNTIRGTDFTKHWRVGGR